jgi:hypothetical protein
MDIEWSEWQVLHPSVVDSELLRNFDQIIIEFHGLLDDEISPLDDANYFDPLLSHRDHSCVDVEKIQVP